MKTVSVKAGASACQMLIRMPNHQCWNTLNRYYEAAVVHWLCSQVFVYNVISAIYVYQHDYTKSCRWIWL